VTSLKDRPNTALLVIDVQRGVVDGAHDVEHVVANIAALVGDAPTTQDMRPWGSPIGPAEAIAYTNMYWSFSAAPGRRGATTTAAEVDLTR
jgi:hypothetical protein